ncbi:hypothetical protein FORC49_0667 [Listeria monocytogenes]|nr:hypothetical protein FORC49_0667 [Listeria monocytogenes]QBZ15065.1 hypothetical protein FORC67_0661 [Listeria monocytogenes]
MYQKILYHEICYFFLIYKYFNFKQKMFLFEQNIILLKK